MTNDNHQDPSDLEKEAEQRLQRFEAHWKELEAELRERWRQRSDELEEAGERKEQERLADWERHAAEREESALGNLQQRETELRRRVARLEELAALLEKSETPPEGLRARLSHWWRNVLKRERRTE